MPDGSAVHNHGIRVMIGNDDSNMRLVQAFPEGPGPASRKRQGFFHRLLEPPAFRRSTGKRMLEKERQSGARMSWTGTSPLTDGPDA